MSNVNHEKLLSIIEFGTFGIGTQLHMAGELGSARRLIKDEWALGYIFGYIDAVTQKFRLSDQDALLVLTASYAPLFAKFEADATLAAVLMEISMRLQDRPTFTTGRRVGGEECLLQFRNELPPMGLVEHLLSFDRGSNAGLGEPQVERGEKPAAGRSGRLLEGSSTRLRSESTAASVGRRSDDLGVANAVAIVGALIFLGVVAFEYFSKAPTTMGTLASSSTETRQDAEHRRAGGETPGQINTTSVENRLEVQIPVEQSDASRPTVVTSFDCELATKAAERLVCRSEELAALDLELSATYSSFLPEAASAEAVRADQREWLWATRDRCDSAECLRTAYENRIAMFRRALAR